MPTWKVGHFQNSKSPLLTLQRSPASSFALSVALSHSTALSDSSSPTFSFVLVLSLLLLNSPFSWSHYRSQPLRSRALTLVLFNVSLSSEKVSLRCEGLRTLRLSKRLVFYFVYVWKACKGCCFKGLLMQKDVFFLFVKWFACKVLVFIWFLMENEVFLVV